MSNVVVLGNPTVKGGSQHTAVVAASIRASGRDVTVVEESSVRRASDTVTRCVEAGVERLVAVGGDGVVSIAVNAVAETSTTLGIVPHGTGNDFARALRLLSGTRSEQIARALADPVPIDAIRTDHGWVATVATLGFSGDVTARANALRWPRGALRYSVATMIQLPRLRSLPLRLEIDGDERRIETTLLAVGNTQFFGGGMRVCPAARPDDGWLHLVSIGDVSRWTFLRVFPTVFSGRHVARHEVTTESGAVIRLDIDPPDGDALGGDSPDGHGVDLWADGERLGPLPVTLEVVPGALRVAGARATE